METAQHAAETYASKIKNEVDQHLNGMDSQIARSISKLMKFEKRQSWNTTDRQSRGVWREELACIANMDDRKTFFNLMKA